MPHFKESFADFSRWRSGKEATCQGRRLELASSISGSERAPREGNGNPLQYSCLENSMDSEPGASTGLQRVRQKWARMHAHAHTRTHTHTHTHIQLEILVSLFWLEVENFGEIAISQMFLVKAYPSWEKPPKENIWRMSMDFMIWQSRKEYSEVYRCTRKKRSHFRQRETQVQRNNIVVRLLGGVW